MSLNPFLEFPLTHLEKAQLLHPYVLYVSLEDAEPGVKRMKAVYAVTDPDDVFRLESNIRDLSDETLKSFNTTRNSIIQKAWGTVLTGLVAKIKHSYPDLDERIKKHRQRNQ